MENKLTGYIDLQPMLGDSFKSWYLSKTPVTVSTLGIVPEKSYPVQIYDFKVQFILPETITITTAQGKKYGIHYPEANRLLGVVRFPQTDGDFGPPIDAKQTLKDVDSKSVDQLADLIKGKRVLTFEAFRIPYFGFEAPDLKDSDFIEIKNFFGADFPPDLQTTYDDFITKRFKDIKGKIDALPNYLSILQNILDLKITDENEIKKLANNIIHFGA